MSKWKWGIWGLLLGLVLASLCSCSCGDRQTKGLGGVLSGDYRKAAFVVVVRGQMCRTATDGYVSDGMTAMEGMGVSMTDVAWDFEAEVKVGAVGTEGLREVQITYTSPATLAGVRVTGVVTPCEEGLKMTYTLSVGDVLAMEVSAEQVAGLLRPVATLLPVGDVVAVQPMAGEEVTLAFHDDEGSYLLQFCPTQSQLPTKARWESEEGWGECWVNE